MSNRACPLCFSKLSRIEVLTRSYDLACPACHAGLNLSLPSRFLSSAAGVVAALLAMRFEQPINSSMGFTFPMLASVFAFVAASALVLFLHADLILRSQRHSIFPHPLA